MKNKRQQAIVDLVSSRAIRTQRELLEELKRLGFETTQATISRDLEELSLFKDRKLGVYRKIPEPASQNELIRLERSIADFVRQVEASGNLIIVKTSPGGAQGVASAIDGIKWEEVMGTVAGDDTILVVARNKQASSKVVKRLKKMMG